jgi:hypothetical protein
MGVPVKVLHIYVARHNDGVRTGDFGPMVELFSEHSVVNFVDLPSGRLAGKEAIARVFAHDPPSSALVVLRVADEGPRHVFAAYGWEKAPSRQAGWLLLQPFDDDRIERLVITF